MQRIREACVTQYDDNRIDWVFRYWLNLTNKGEEAATSTQYGREIAERVAEDAARWRARENGTAP